MHTYINKHACLFVCGCTCVHLYSISHLAITIRYTHYRGQKTNDVCKFSTLRYSTERTTAKTKGKKKESDRRREMERRLRD